MNFNGHLTGGIGASGIAGGFSVLAFNLPPAYTACVIMGTFIGAHLPDLDIASTPRKWFGRIGVFIVLFCMIATLTSDLIVLSIVANFIGMISLLLMSGGIKHRGPTHKYWFPILLNYHFILSFLPDILSDYVNYINFQGTVIPYLLTGLSIGVVTHFLLDSIYPWQKQAWV